MLRVLLHPSYISCQVSCSELENLGQKKEVLPQAIHCLWVFVDAYLFVSEWRLAMLVRNSHLSGAEVMKKCRYCTQYFSVDVGCCSPVSARQNIFIHTYLSACNVRLDLSVRYLLTLCTYICQ